MTRELKYISEEQYNESVLGLVTQEEDPVDIIKSGTGILSLLIDRKIPEGMNEIKALGTTEFLLNFLETYEEFELCAMIITTWPELKYQK